MDKEKETSYSIDKIISGVEEILILFEDLNERVKAIELIIEGKPSQNIPSLHKDVQELKTATEKIRISLEENFIKDLKLLKELLAEREKNEEKNKILLDKKLAEIENTCSFLKRKIKEIEENTFTVKETMNGLQTFADKFKNIPKFITWLIPILSFIIVFLNFILPLINKFK